MLCRGHVHARPAALAIRRKELRHEQHNAVLAATDRGARRSVAGGSRSRSGRTVRRRQVNRVAGSGSSGGVGFLNEFSDLFRLRRVPGDLVYPPQQLLTLLRLHQIGGTTWLRGFKRRCGQLAEGGVDELPELSPLALGQRGGVVCKLPPDLFGIVRMPRRRIGVHVPYAEMYVALPIAQGAAAGR